MTKEKKMTLYERLLERIKNLDVSLIEHMSPDGLAMLTKQFDNYLVRAIMCKAEDNDTQRKIFAKIKSAYKSWMKDTDSVWGTMPYLETYPDYMNKMLLDVECGMIITENGSIPAPKKRPYVPISDELIQEIRKLATSPLTNNSQIKEIVYNISTEKPAETQKMENSGLASRNCKQE